MSNCNQPHVTLSWHLRSEPKHPTQTHLAIRNARQNYSTCNFWSFRRRWFKKGVWDERLARGQTKLIVVHTRVYQVCPQGPADRSCLDFVIAFATFPVTHDVGQDALTFRYVVSCVPKHLCREGQRLFISARINACESITQDAFKYQVYTQSLIQSLQL